MADQGEVAAANQVKISTSLTKTKGYLVIDHGDEIRADIKYSQEQIQKQIDHLQREITLVWRTMQDLMILFAPMIISWMGFFIIRMFFSHAWEGLWIALNSTLMAGCLAFFMTPLHDSLDKLLNALNEFSDMKFEKIEDELPEDIGFGDAGQDDLITPGEGEENSPTEKCETSDDGEENTNNNDTD